ncbi:MAG TPA: hypothetical protein VLT45_21380 [Kofleriaceae bacterium]|nr:hypothetical protein [Kofleriaceae bacterium]
MNQGLAAIGRMRRRVLIWAIVAAALGLGLGLVPLFGVLGFESALALAVLGSFCALDLGAAFARALQEMPAPGLVRATYPGRAVARLAPIAAALPAGVLLVPIAVCAVRGIWIPTCDWWFGIKAMLLMPLATAALGGMFGFAVGLAVGVRARRSWLPHRSTVLALCAWPVVALVAAVRFYAAPPVFTYNAILGYYPGNLYDENVQLGATLVWSRIEELVWVIAALALVAWRLDVPTMRIARARRPLQGRYGLLAAAIAVVLAGGLLHTQGGELGYNVTADDIEDVLDGRIETAHFVIHYARTPEIERDIKLIAEDHELRYAEVTALLGVGVPDKLESFYFGDRDQKARWMGARDVEMAKPWRHEIYLDHRPFPHTSLRHEIAHAVASEFGDPIFGVAARRVFGIPVPSPGLIEGLAVAVDWPGGDYGRLTPHESVRALEEMGARPQIRSLLSLGFLAQSSQRSYMTAGSFMRFLLDKYGAPAFRRLYSTGDFDTAYGKSLATLETEWRAMLEKVAVPKAVVEGARERFRTGSVFARPCPHAVAADMERAATAALRGEREKAIAIMRDVCRDAPEEPRNSLELGDYLVGGTAKQRAEALARWKAIAEDDDLTPSLRAEAMTRLAHAQNDNALIERAATLPVDPNMRRQLDAEVFALHHEGPAGKALRGYFFIAGQVLDGRGWAQLAVLAEPSLGFAHYLLGLQLQLPFGEKAAWARSADELDQAVSLGLPGVDFARNGARKLAVAAYRSGDVAKVRHAIAVLRGDDMSIVDHLLADDWEARLRFDEQGHL